MGNVSGHQCKVKISGSEKKVNENTYDISSIKRVTKKFLEVSRCSRAKQRQRNVQKKCAARALALAKSIYYVLSRGKCILELLDKHSGSIRLNEVGVAMAGCEKKTC